MPNFGDTISKLGSGGTSVMFTMIWIVVIFLLVGAWMIKTGYNTDFDDAADTKNFVVRFGKWIMQIGGNVVEITVIHYSNTPCSWRKGVS